MISLTPSEIVVMRVLSDGRQHPLTELLETLDVTRSNLTRIVCELRAKLKVRGETIVTHYVTRPDKPLCKVASYQHVQKVSLG